MRTRALATCAVIAALSISCTAIAPSEPVTVDPDEAEADAELGSAALVPSIRCSGVPDAGPTEKFRHTSSKITSALGSPKHRGIDLIVAAESTSQTLVGAASYTIADKALEDEDIDVFACRSSAWKKIGRARTDDEGGFRLTLTGTKRLKVGLRDLFLSVAGDRTGTRFVAYVAPTGSSVIVSDVDGTLTASENEFLTTVVTGADAAIRPGAPAALGVAKARGYQVIYLTARGQQYTEVSRGWFGRKGFPRAPLRLSPSFLTLPGGDTVAYKTEALQAITDAGFELAAGIGNRASDIEAYRNAGIAANRTYVESTEFASEVQPEIVAGRAIGFASHAELATNHLANLPQL